MGGRDEQDMEATGHYFCTRLADSHIIVYMVYRPKARHRPEIVSDDKVNCIYN
jgi:hypothetical protein